MEPVFAELIGDWRNKAHADLGLAAALSGMVADVTGGSTRWGHC